MTEYAQASAEQKDKVLLYFSNLFEIASDLKACVYVNFQPSDGNPNDRRIYIEMADVLELLRQTADDPTCLVASCDPSSSESGG